uniref:PPOX class putative F420-dependent enzyme n=1 Tax=uncultured bacterium CSL144 TaxID=1091570 RepID=G4WVP6_9BACT|nr:PPOX class putative F420-dependent enzyme [uncultured bacterium CSL144]
MKIPQSVRELLPKAPLAHLTTLNPDGGPQVTVVWVGIENEEFVIGHLAVHQKVRNIRRDPRVALSLLGDKTNAKGLREYVVIYGNARVTEGGAVKLLQGLARTYLGPNAEYPPAGMQSVPGYITRITPTRLTGIGPWAEKAAD